MIFNALRMYTRSLSIRMDSHGKHDLPTLLPGPVHLVGPGILHFKVESRLLVNKVRCITTLCTE